MCIHFSQAASAINKYSQEYLLHHSMFSVLRVPHFVISFRTVSRLRLRIFTLAHNTYRAPFDSCVCMRDTVRSTLRRGKEGD